MNALEIWLDKIAKCHPSKLDLSLERISRVADRLNLREKICPVITVSGTNGKGTAVHTLNQIYNASGYKPGAFFSPHIWVYNERIIIHNQQATDEQIISAFEIINTARGEITLTYFEWTFLAALFLFHRANVNIMILEVGLGGEFDAVNMIDPDVSVITNIDYDHQHWLGESLEKIGQAKAGILRPSVPLVLGVIQPPQSILTKAREYQCPIVFTDNNQALCQQVCEHIKLPVKHIPPTRPPGRVQRLSYEDKEVILDAAHNPHGARYLAEFIKTLEAKPTTAIFSCLKDKLKPGLIIPIQSIVNQWVIVPINNSRAASLDEIQAHLPSPARECKTIKQALENSKNDRILIYGSFHLISGVPDGLFTDFDVD